MVLPVNNRSRTMFFDFGLVRHSLSENVSMVDTPWAVTNDTDSTFIRHVVDMLFSVDHFRHYFIPSNVIIGIMGNVISLVTLLQTNLRRQAASHHVAAKCVSDSIFLICLFLLWLRSLGVDLYSGGVLCHLISMLNHSSHFLSTWFLVLLALDRYLVVCQPSPCRCSRNWEKGVCPALSRCLPCCVRGSDPATKEPTEDRPAPARRSAVFRAKIWILAVSVAALVVYLNISLTVGVSRVSGTQVCVPQPRFFQALQILGHLDVFINVLLPYIALMTLTFATCRRTLQLHIVRNKTIGRDELRKLQPALSRRRAETRLTRVVAVMCATFVLGTLPMQALRLTHTIRELVQMGQYLSLNEFFLQHAFHIPYCSTFAVNFPILLLCDASFRKALRHVFVRFGFKVKLAFRRKKSSALTLNAMAFAVDFSSTLVNMRLNETSLA